MGIKTKIEYADSTINPVMGCTGCELYDTDTSKNHCYAANLINRYAGKKGWPKEFNKPEYFLERIEKAIQWPDLTGTKRESKPWLNDYPRIVFVNDLSDGFCPDVDPVIWLQPFMERMAKSPHIWLLLTKWPKQMRRFFEQYPAPRNFWLGGSVPNQKAIWRIEELLQIRAAKRIVSLEPLLEWVLLPAWCNAECDMKNPQGQCAGCATSNNLGLDAIFAGGESGPNARPMHPDWARSIRGQCQASGTPYFFKQWGRNAPIGRNQWGGWTTQTEEQIRWLDKTVWMAGYEFVPIGKKRAGRLLDGREWNGFPSYKSS
jgi:protein gp37